MSKKRPIGFILLGLVMGWLGIATLWNMWVVYTGPEAVLPTLMAPIMVAWGISALVTMIGLWTMRHWVMIALKTWMALCVAMLLALGYYFNALLLGGVLGLFGIIIFMSAFFAFLHGYVETTMTRGSD